MDIGFVFFFVYMLGVNWFINKMNERHTEYVMAKLVFFFGSTAAVLLFVYNFVLTPQDRSADVVRLDAVTLSIVGVMLVIFGIYRFGFRRWPMFRNHSMTTHWRVVTTLLLLSFAGCVTYTLSSR